MRTSVAIALLLGLSAACGVLWAMRAPGPGLDPDSMSYFAAADSIVNTGEPRVPFDVWSSGSATRRLRDFPPGFPAAIAALESTGMRGERAATWVEAASAFATVTGLVLVVSAAAGQIAATVAAVAVLASPALVEDHYIVLSEPLFLALLVAMVALTASERQRAWALGITAGVAVMVRYAGLALPLSAFVWTALSPPTRQPRLLAATLAGAPGVVAFLVWSRWAGNVRDFGWKSGFGATLREGADTLEVWLVPLLSPSPLRTVLAIVAIVALAVLVIRGVRAARAASLPALRLLAASGLIASCYVLLVTFSRLFADDAIPFDARIASPLFLLSTIAVVTSVAAQWRSLPPGVRAAVVTVGALWCVVSAITTFGELQDLGEDGWGLASAAWIGSDLKAWLLADGGRHELFSDNPPALYSMAHRPSRSLPPVTDPTTLRRFGEVLAARPSLLIAFEEPDAPLGARGTDFARLLSLREMLHTGDGSVFEPRRP